jgi:pyroglutamyl-peptidase
MWLIALEARPQTLVQNSRFIQLFKTHLSPSAHTATAPRRPSARSARLAPARLQGAAQPCVLVTGFEAFGDDPGGQGLNPSALAAQALHGLQIHGHAVVAAVLPCVFGQSVKVLKQLIKKHQPGMVVCLGQAGGRAGISIERVAVNLDDAPLADNAGVVLQGTPVMATGPAAYFSSLPVHPMLAALQHAGVPCELSSTAGHFVCNHVFYALMNSIAKSKLRPGLPAGFVHVPYLPEQAAASGTAGLPSMALDDITRGLHIALQAALEQHAV